MGTIKTLNIVLILICRMEFHMGVLKKICSVCGRRFKKKLKRRERGVMSAKSTLRNWLKPFALM